MVTTLIMDGVLMAGVAVAIVSLLVWAVMTQHRDHGVLSAGPIFRRRVWSRSRRRHAGSRHPLYSGRLVNQPRPAH